MTTTSLHKPCMIAIEGTKGSGKSTLLEQMKQNAFLFAFEPVYYRPTAPAPDWLPVSRFLSDNPHLTKMDTWQERLYAERAQWHSAQIPEMASCVIADRCIATSYATRWQKWQKPMVTIKRVDKLHTIVPLPHFIIWLDCPPWLAIERIQKRTGRNYGLHDQTPERIWETYEAYKEMMQNPPERIAYTKWITVDANQALETLTAYLIEIINQCYGQYLQKQGSVKNHFHHQ